MQISLMKRPNNLPATNFYPWVYKNWLEQSIKAIDQPIELYDFFTPMIDVYETSSNIVFEVELPGVRPDNFSVEVKDDLIHFRGERHRVLHGENMQYLRMERRQGTFSRTLRLPSGLKAETIQVGYNDGILNVSFDKDCRP